MDWTTYVDVLSSTPTRLFLLSAFDYFQVDRGARNAIKASLEKARGHGSLIVLDSGGYEASWLRAEWTHGNYAEAVREIAPDILFTFDQPDHTSGDPYATALDDLDRDSDISPSASVVPIVHGTPVELTDAVGRLGLLDPPMIAVAERRLGQGIVERRQSVVALRQALASSGNDVPLHLLGTGDPRSIVAYTQDGADSFDAVDWSQYAVDPKTAELVTASRLDWMPRRQRQDDSFTADLVLGNLQFYEAWMDRLRQDRNAGTSEMADRWVPLEVARPDGDAR